MKHELSLLRKQIDYICTWFGHYISKIEMSKVIYDGRITYDNDNNF